jgi:hypothetical protein
MTEGEWFELERRYVEVFSCNIPRMMLPQDEDTAAALVKEAIVTGDDSVFEKGIPADAAI